jgi:hypothetical protein
VIKYLSHGVIEQAIYHTVLTIAFTSQEVNHTRKRILPCPVVKLTASPFAISSLTPSVTVTIRFPFSSILMMSCRGGFKRSAAWRGHGNHGLFTYMVPLSVERKGRHILV